MSTQPEWLKWEFDVLKEIFDEVEMNTNAKNMVDMVWKVPRITRSHSDAVYDMFYDF